MNMPNKEYLKRIDERINERLSSSLLLVLFSIPAVFILSTVGVFRFSLLAMAEFAVVAAFGLISPRILYKKGVPTEFLKFYIITTVSIVVSILATQPHVGIYITYILGLILSLFYLDVVLTMYAAILNYVLMIAALFFRERAYMLETGLDDPVHAWMAYGMGFTIEFLVVSPVMVAVARQGHRHLFGRMELLGELEHDNKRYEIALDNASDVLFEYNEKADVLVYYGALLPGETTDAHTAKTIDNFRDKLNSGEIVYKEDKYKLDEYIDRDCIGKVEIRLIYNDDETYWVEIEGNVYYDSDDKRRIVGRFKDINVEKVEEENRIADGEGIDELTGFYGRAAGVRIIRRFRADAMQGYHSFVYCNFVSGRAIRARAGAVFCDAILMRIAGIFSSELRSTDVAVRFSTDEFILYFQDRSPTALEQTIGRLKSSIASIYVGEGIIEFLEMDFKVYESVQELENDALNSDLIKDIEVLDDYNDDVVFYAFNILEHATDIDESINLLLEKIGRRYSLDYVRILEESPMPNLQFCINEWCDAEGNEPSMYSETLSVQRMKKSASLFICDSKELGIDGMYVIFKGSGLDGDFRESICSKLKEVAHIMGNCIQRFKYENESRAKTDFISFMSHEIRTPMNSIAGFAELLMQDDPSDQTMEYATNILDSSHDLLEIINDLLDISKIESGKFEIILAQYRLHEIIEDVVSLISVQASKKGISFDVNVDGKVPDGLVGDDIRIRQILINIINNAVKYTKVGGINVLVTWKGSVEDGRLVVSVKDSGIGIKEEEIGFVFNAFEQADSRNNRGITGTGLGLTITKNLVELMDGEINVYSEYGKGTEFVFEIPQAVFDGKAYDYKGKDKNVRRQAFVIPFTTMEARTLVVDDNHVNLKVAAGLLSKFQIETITCNSGEEALKILETDDNFDIIFMDHLMPGMDGIQCTGYIRSSDREKLQNVPIVAFTANAIKGVENDFAVAGMNGFLAKPINLKDLSTVLENFLPEDKRIYINPEV